MNGFRRVKIIQLVVTVLFVAIDLYLIFYNPEVFHIIGTVPVFGIIFLGFWALQVVNFGFLIYDFSVYGGLKRKYGEIDMALYSDPMTGIGNRSSLDAFIQEFSETELPYGTGAITITLTHMGEVNGGYGSKQGDAIIKDFSNILSDCGKGRCFVGRNGGNTFLALFKATSKREMQAFLDDVKDKCAARNEDDSKAYISFKFGAVIYDHEEERLSMSQLVAKSYNVCANKDEDYLGRTTPFLSEEEYNKRKIHSS